MENAGLAVALTRELMLAAAVGILVIGIDDLAIDLLYWSRRLWRRLTIYRRFERMTLRTLPDADRPGAFAILVPAWQEAEVIGAMLRQAQLALRHADDCIFVGIYPNDPATRAAVAAVPDARIVPVIQANPGPTTKADCLNGLWAALIAREEQRGRRFKAIVLHDAEDVVHSAELRLFDRMVERFALVQLPVLPLVDRTSPWIAGHYLDEFAESHAKDLVVREAMGAAVPSAGVGCAIERAMMDRVASLRGGGPFDPEALTEDYELGLRIGWLGGRGVVVRMVSETGRIIATREHFPATLSAAVRQKSRWLIGIALAGWDRMGWQGSLAERWWRMRDRKSVLAALVTLIAYLAALANGAVMFVALVAPAAVPMPLVAEGSLLSVLLPVNAALLGWRLAMRAIFTARAHGPLQGLLAIPRAVVANIIAILACFRALGLFMTGWRRREALRWEKTTHAFPADLPAE